jgi:uncharacterized protein DUF748
MSSAIAQPKPRRRRWGRFFLFLLIALLVAVAALYFTVTSQWFLRGVLRRAAADSLGVELEVTRVALRLSGHLSLEGLELVGPEPESDRILAESVEIGFSPRSLLSGSPHLQRLDVRGGEASLTRRGDGTLALLADAPESGESGETPAVHLDALALSDLTLHLRDHANGLGEVLEADLTLATLAAESIDPREGAESIEIDLRVDRIAQGDHTQITAGHLSGTGDLAIRSRGGLEIAAAFESRGFEGQWRGTPIEDVAVTLEADTQTDADGRAQIDATLDLTRREVTVGQFALSGTCDTRTWDSDLMLTLGDVTDQALEILWAQPGGADWGDSRAEGTVALTIRGGGDQISAEGQVQLRNLSVLAPEIAQERTPPLDLVLQSAVRADLAAERLHIDSLTTMGDLEGRRLLDAELDRPITLSWGEIQEEVPPAGVTFSLSDLDLGRVRPLMPSDFARQVRAGHLSADGTIEVEGGQVITAEGRLQARGLVLAPGEDVLPALDLDSDGRVIADVATRHLAITRSVTQVAGGQGETGVLELSGDMDFQTHEGTLQTRAEGFDVPLLSLLIGDAVGPRPVSGRVDTDTVITLSEGGEEIHLAGRTAWRNLSARLDASRAEPLSVPGGVSDFEITLGNSGVSIADLSVDFGERGSLTARGQSDWEGHTDLEVETQGLDLAPLEDLVDEHLRIQITEGQVTGSTHLSGAGGDWSVAFDGLLRLDTWQLPAWDDPMPSLASRGIAMLSLDSDGRLTADPLRLALSMGDHSPTQVEGHLSMSTVDLASPIRYEGQLREVELADIRDLLALDGTLIPSSGVIDWSGALSLHLREDATEIQANGHADARGLRLDVPDLHESLSEPLDVSLDLTASTHLGEQITIEAERCEATLSRGGRGVGDISIQGTADPMSQIADLDVVIDSLELEALAGLMPEALAERFGEGEMRYRGNVQSAESGAALTSQGDLTVTGDDLSLMAEHHVTWTGNLLEITDTGITTRLGSTPPQTITLTASLDPSGTELSTFTLIGGELDLTEFLPDSIQGQETAVQAGPARPWSIALSDLPDPGPLRLRGDILLDQWTWGTLQIREPQVGIAWERLSPGEPGCEISLSSLDAQVVGPRHTGRLQGDALLMQEGAGTPLTHSVNLTLTETDFDNLLPTLAPGLVDRVNGSMAMRRCQLSGEGRVWPRDFQAMQGVIEIDLADGEITEIPLLRAIIAATGLTTLERLQFFAGGLTLRPEGDHLALRTQQPFWVRGDLSLVTADGSVFYDGRQDLSIAIGVHESFPHLGSLMGDVASGLAFPRNATYPEYRMFPLPIDSEGSWSNPRVHLGLPRVDQFLPGLLEELLE